MDKWVFRIIHSSYTIEFASPLLLGCHFHENFLKQEVESLLQWGAKKRVPLQYQGRGFYLTYFLVPKRRAVGDPHLFKLKFCMVTLGSTISSLEKDCGLQFLTWRMPTFTWTSTLLTDAFSDSQSALSPFSTEYCLLALLLSLGSLPNFSLS